MAGEGWVWAGPRWGSASYAGTSPSGKSLPKGPLFPAENVTVNIDSIFFYSFKSFLLTEQNGNLCSASCQIFENRDELNTARQ
jgi:hypothetical protein